MVVRLFKFLLKENLKDEGGSSNRLQEQAVLFVLGHAHHLPFEEAVTKLTCVVI